MISRRPVTQVYFAAQCRLALQSLSVLLAALVALIVWFTPYRANMGEAFMVATLLGWLLAWPIGAWYEREVLLSAIDD